MVYQLVVTGYLIFTISADVPKAGHGIAERTAVVSGEIINKRNNKLVSLIEVCHN